MKRAVLLRQKVPKDVERITFNTFEEIDDLYLVLFARMCEILGIEMAESWNWGGRRYHQFTDTFVERWIPNFEAFVHQPIEAPDLIFARGGFEEYIPVMQRFPNAFKIYYGAGKRHNPLMVPDRTRYDLVLVDTKGQFEDLDNLGYTPYPFTKPACDQIFFPVDVAKWYDVVFIANAPQKKIKGHEWLFRRLAGSGLKILQIGIFDDEVMNWGKKYELDIAYTGWIPRRKIPQYACKAYVGVCASDSYESCPRVIPEYLAMDIPVVVRDTVRISQDYVNEQTGMFADHDVEAAIKSILLTSYWPRQYYNNHLTLETAATNLAMAIKGMI